jgi:hypothetical protein
MTNLLHWFVAILLVVVEKGGVKMTNLLHWFVASQFVENYEEQNIYFYQIQQVQ